MNRKQAQKAVLELHIRRLGTGKKAPKASCSNRVYFDKLFESKQEAEDACKKWSIALTNRVRRSITVQAQYKYSFMFSQKGAHPVRLSHYKTITHKHKYNEVLAN